MRKGRRKKILHELTHVLKRRHKQEYGFYMMLDEDTFRPTKAMSRTYIIIM